MDFFLLKNILDLSAIIVVLLGMVVFCLAYWHSLEEHKSQQKADKSGQSGTWALGLKLLPHVTCVGEAQQFCWNTHTVGEIFVIS